MQLLSLPLLQEQAHLVGDVAAAPSLGANASAPGTAALGSTMTASATSAALPTDASVTAAQAYAGVQEDSKTAPHAEVRVQNPLLECLQMLNASESDTSLTQ